MENTNNKKIIIIDGNALIHRSFHALPPTMMTKEGILTNAVYGFTLVLLKTIREFKPDYVVLTLDKKGPTFRHQEYKEYKAKRIKAPNELYEQIPLVKEIAKAFNIPIFEKDGFEADDLIGCIAKKVDKNINKIIVTGDQDTLQLINENTKVYTMSHGLSDSVIYDIKAVKNRFSLLPIQMVDYKALRGDPSDNIPGVKGIGEKTAIELLKNFKTLDNIYKNIESKKIKERTKALLKEFKDDAYLSKKLATIKTDIEINFNLFNAKFGNFDQEKLIKLLSELEFKSLLPRVQNLKKTSGDKINDQEKEKNFINKFARDEKLFKYNLINDEKNFKDFLLKIKKQKEFVFDTETSDFDTLNCSLLGISFSWKDKEAYYINLKNQSRGLGTKVRSNLFDFDKEDIKSNLGWLEKLKNIFENEKIKKYGHNIKFDLKVLDSCGIKVKNITFDTMIASYLLNSGSRQHGLDSVTFSEFGFEKISKDDLLGKGKEKITFSEVPLEKISIYSCEDADFTFRLVKKLSKDLKINKLEKLFKNIEMPLMPILAKMETNGIKIDKKLLLNLSDEINEKIKSLEKNIKKLAGIDFNINSTQQLRDVLFNRLQIPTKEVSKTKTGLSTAADELFKLKDYHPIIKLIQEYRELNKLATTYIDALPLLINKKTLRLHTSYNQTVAATGRLSSTEPNLQNIPIRTEIGNEIRKSFIAEDGYKLLSLDYSQIELRLAAHMSGDSKMIKAFKNNEDIHTATAAEINEVPFEKVTSNMRREAKAINFGILYGQGPHGLSQFADIPYARAKEFIDKYFRIYKNIKIFVEKSIDMARKKGYAQTLFGRLRYIPEINSSIMQVRKGAERIAINTPLQGSAADMIKVAMIEIDSLIKKEFNNNEVKMLLQVHDELLFEINNKYLEDASKKIKNIMEDVIKLKVPVIVESEFGNNWGEMKRI